MGTGLSTEILPLQPVAFPPRRRYQATSAAPPGTRGERKAHHRLSREEIDQIRQLPVRWYRTDPLDGRISLEEIARQFNVTPLTLRNLVLHGKRLDLRRPVLP